MRFCYAHRRFALYPQSVDSWNLSHDNYTDEFLAKTKSLDFDAIEVGLEVMTQLGSEAKVKEFKAKFNDRVQHMLLTQKSKYLHCLLA